MKFATGAAGGRGEVGGAWREGDWGGGWGNTGGSSPHIIKFRWLGLPKIVQCASFLCVCNCGWLGMRLHIGATAMAITL